ncbi:NUDIX hydrolase domain-like protein, partial [Phaeosphaeriaceae sp. PMI808]
QILLVQRAKDEIAFPGHWEFPGGKAEDDDSSLLEAAAREFYEETHGRISHFERVVHQREFDHRIDKTIKGLKITFEAKIEEWSVVLNPKEHQEYLWATKDEVL